VNGIRIELGDRSLYPELKADAYLAFAAIAPASSLVKAAVTSLLTSYAEHGSSAIFTWIEQRERLREKLALLLDTKARHIALTSGTTRGISDLALSLPWQSGDRIVLFQGEFPANVSPWQRAAELFGLELCFVDLAHAVEDPGSFLEPLEQLLARGVRLVAVSAVQFQTGLRMPLAAISALCQRYGAELCVDAIQACGVVPLAVESLGIDYLACGAHKWLLGLEGAGFVYARPDRARALLPRTAGWLSHEEGTLFLFGGPGQLRYDRPLKPTLQVLEGGSSNAAGFVALEAGIDPILQLTPRAIFEHVSQYLDGLEQQLERRGFRSRRSADPERRSGILAVEPPAGVTAAALVGELRARGVVASMPDGLLRFAPHFPSSLGELPRVAGALDDSLRALGCG
jgi:cysteine desulfurase/selenocysteine lyase